MGSKSPNLEPARAVCMASTADELDTPAGSDDWMDHVGYEAANPMLQASVWFKAAQGCCDEGGNLLFPRGIQWAEPLDSADLVLEIGKPGDA